MEYLLPLAEEVNEERTAAVKNDPRYIQYIQWALDNGCKFPSLDFPVAFGPYGVVGSQAKADIPPMKVSFTQGLRLRPAVVDHKRRPRAGQRNW